MGTTLGALAAVGASGRGSPHAEVALPAAAFFDDAEMIDAVAEASAAVTHNHPEGIKGAKAVAEAIYLATKEKKEIKDIIMTKYGYDLDRTTDEIRPGYRFNETCQGSVPEAITCFLEGNSFEEVVRLAVSLGSDADTQACIAGSIAAVRYGVPEEIKREVIKRLPGDILSVYNKFCDI